MKYFIGCISLMLGFISCQNLSKQPPETLREGLVERRMDTINKSDSIKNSRMTEQQHQLIPMDLIDYVEPLPSFKELSVEKH